MALAHVLLFAFGIASLALWFLFADGIRRASAVAPALPWVVAWWASTRTALARIDPGSLGSKIEAYWHGPAAKLAEVGRALVVASTSGGLEWSVLVALGVVAATAVAVERRADSVRPGLGWLRLVALLAICAYAFLPYSIYSRERVTVALFILYPRFLVLAPLVILPLLAWPRGRLGAGLAAIVSS